MDAKKYTVNLVADGDDPAAVFTCPDCDYENIFLLKDYPKGSTFICTCGHNLEIPFSEDELIAKLRKDAEQALKEGIKNLKF